MEPKQDEEVFATIGEHAEDSGLQVIESMCMQCQSEKGETRLLFTVVPHFREIIIASFSCSECHHKNTEIQFGGVFLKQGKVMELKLDDSEDLNRQIVKSTYCTMMIPELQLEIPPKTQGGSLNTLEGVLTRVIEGLEEHQPVWKHMNIDQYNRINEVIGKIKVTMENPSEHPLTIIMSDPSGNSNIENKCLPKQDPKLKVRYFERTKEQDKLLGLNIEENVDEEGNIIEKKEEEEIVDTKPTKKRDLLSEEDAEKFKDVYVTTNSDVTEFKENCHVCFKEGILRMVICNIPHFKEIVLMGFVCTHCGYKSNNVKPGGSISEKGKKITLNVTDPDDMTRDILKSETCSISIPELDLELTEGTLGGKFTTIEGILEAVHQELYNTSFHTGDSSESVNQDALKTFLAKIKEYATGKHQFTIIVDDPLANSFIQNPFAPDADPEMVIQEYQRSFDQNETLGLNDINTENYT